VTWLTRVARGVSRACRWVIRGVASQQATSALMVTVRRSTFSLAQALKAVANILCDALAPCEPALA